MTRRKKAVIYYPREAQKFCTASHLRAEIQPRQSSRDVRASFYDALVPRGNLAGKRPRLCMSSNVPTPAKSVNAA